jgi:hypothetical protein
MSNVPPPSTGADTSFPYGAITLGLPDWNLIVATTMDVDTNMKHLRNILCHVEVGKEPTEIYERIKFVNEKLWAGYHSLSFLVREVKRHEQEMSGGS